MAVLGGSEPPLEAVEFEGVVLVLEVTAGGGVVEVVLGGRFGTLSPGRLDLSRPSRRAIRLSDVSSRSAR